MYYHIRIIKYRFQIHLWIVTIIKLLFGVELFFRFGMPHIFDLVFNLVVDFGHQIELVSPKPS